MLRIRIRIVDGNLVYIRIFQIKSGSGSRGHKKNRNPYQQHCQIGIGFTRFIFLHLIHAALVVVHCTFCYEKVIKTNIFILQNKVVLVKVLCIFEFLVFYINFCIIRSLVDIFIDDLIRLD